jgi:hypothetical protein
VEHVGEDPQRTRISQEDGGTATSRSLEVRNKTPPRVGSCHRPSYAVLVDAENARPADLPSITTQISEYGKADVRRLYGPLFRFRCVLNIFL